MKIVVVKPGQPAEIRDIEGSLESMQKVVGGYIECLNPWGNNICLICNEEGKIQGLKPNRSITYKNGARDIIAGTFFFCRSKGEEFAGFSDAGAAYIASLFKEVPEWE